MPTVELRSPSELSLRDSFIQLYLFGFPNPFSMFLAEGLQDNIGWRDLRRAREDQKCAEHMTELMRHQLCVNFPGTDPDRLVNAAAPRHRERSIYRWWRFHFNKESHIDIHLHEDKHYSLLVSFPETAWSNKVTPNKLLAKGWKFRT